MIITSDNVFDLLLNFTAMGFVSELDEVVFMLATQGFAGQPCEEAADLVLTTTYSVPQRKMRATKIIMLVALFAGMVGGWSVVYHNQVSGKYLCKTILVQMGDDLRPELASFSGLYDLETSGAGPYVTYVERRASGKTKFGYCEDLEAWTLYWGVDSDDDDDNSNETTTFSSEKSSGNPCEWAAMSSATSSFDMLTTAGDTWYVQKDSRIVVLDPFLMRCHDCTADGDDECNGRGTCSNAVCTCQTGYYGIRCEFEEPCPSLVMDSRTQGFLGTRPWSTSFERLQVPIPADGTNTTALGDNSTTVTAMMNVDTYHRPVYFNSSSKDLIFFTGRRWVVTTGGLLFKEFQTITNSTNDIKLALATYFHDIFHAYWANYSVAFISEPVDFATPNDANSPLGLQFYIATAKKSLQQLEVQAPDSLESGANLLCGICNNDTNPCLYDGVCLDGGACHCSLMSSGQLCEVPPVGNGYCNSFFNRPLFGYDGGYVL